MARNPESSDCDVQSTLFQLLRHPELSIDLGLSACRYLNASNRFLLCERGLNELLVRYTGSSNLARIYVGKLESALHRLPDDEALPYVQTFVKDDHIMTSMDEDAMRLVHMILWEQAEKYQEEGNTNQVLAWYNISLNLFGAFNKKSKGRLKDNTELRINMAKVYRNCCSCLMLLGRLDEAKEAVNEAEKLDKDNPRTHFALFKVSLAEGNRMEAIKATDNIEQHYMHKTAERLGNDIKEGNNSEETTVQGFIYLAAQMAFEKRERAIAIGALRHIAKCSINRMAKLLALRCLVRLYLSVIEEGEDRICKSPMDGGSTCTDPEEKLRKLSKEDIVAKAVCHIQSAHEVLEDISNDPLQESEISCRQETSYQGRECVNNYTLFDEATWFMKISWNFAIECKHEAGHVKTAFQLCYKFLRFLPLKESDLARQKTCLLMSCAASLEIARKSYERKTVESNLRAVLDLVGQYKKVCDEMTAAAATQVADETKSLILIALFEFEACVKLTPPRARSIDTSSCVLLTELQQVMDKIEVLPNATVKTFQTIAALCLDPPARHVILSKRALKLAIKKLDCALVNSTDENQRKQQAETYSKLYHSLVDLALAEGSAINPASKEEAWCYISEVLRILDGKLKRYYPELEILWMTIKTWNVGAKLFAANHVINSEKWCAGAMSFLAYLKHFKSSYESHMNEVYQEILMKKDVIAAKQNPSDLF